MGEFIVLLVLVGEQQPFADIIPVINDIGDLHKALGVVGVHLQARLETLVGPQLIGWRGDDPEGEI